MVSSVNSHSKATSRRQHLWEFYLPLGCLQGGFRASTTPFGAVMFSARSLPPTPSILGGVWGLGFGVWGVGFGIWGLVFGVWSL